MLSRIDDSSWRIAIDPGLIKVRGFSSIDDIVPSAATPPAHRTNDLVESIHVGVVIAVETVVTNVVVFMDDLVLDLLWDLVFLEVKPRAEKALDLN